MLVVLTTKIFSQIVGVLTLVECSILHVRTRADVEK